MCVHSSLLCLGRTVCQLDVNETYQRFNGEIPVPDEPCLGGRAAHALALCLGHAVLADRDGVVAGQARDRDARVDILGMHGSRRSPLPSCELAKISAADGSVREGDI